MKKEYFVVTRRDDPTLPLYTIDTADGAGNLTGMVAMIGLQTSYRPLARQQADRIAACLNACEGLESLPVSVAAVMADNDEQGKIIARLANELSIVREQLAKARMGSDLVLIAAGEGYDSDPDDDYNAASSPQIWAMK